MVKIAELANTPWQYAADQLLGAEPMGGGTKQLFRGCRDVSMCADTNGKPSANADPP